MSILLGPFEKGQKPLENNSKDDREFLVFGYQCRLYRNDEKATMENEELLLIPWMGDRSLMVDRYRDNLLSLSFLSDLFIGMMLETDSMIKHSLV